MRGPAFLRFNEHKKQIANPLTLALSPRGERGHSQEVAINRRKSQ